MEEQISTADVEPAVDLTQSVNSAQEAPGIVAAEEQHRSTANDEHINFQSLILLQLKGLGESSAAQLDLLKELANARCSAPPVDAGAHHVERVESELAAARSDNEALWNQLEDVIAQKDALAAECVVLRKMLLSRLNGSASADEKTAPQERVDEKADDVSGCSSSAAPTARLNKTLGEQTLFGFRLRHPSYDDVVGRGLRRPVKTSSANHTLEPPVTAASGIVRLSPVPRGGGSRRVSPPLNFAGPMEP